jgi:prephenate dehydrogenase
VELRVPVADRPGAIAEVTTLAGRLGVNIYDFETVHSMEGEAGVLVMVVSETGVPAFESALVEAGYHVSKVAVT